MMRRTALVVEQILALTPLIILASVTPTQGALPSFYMQVTPKKKLYFVMYSTKKFLLLFVQVIEDCVGFQGGAGMAGLNTNGMLGMEQQLKRVAGFDASADLNITAMRGLSDYDLYRILTLAVIGNFTSAKAPAWQQPCTIAVVPNTGEFVAIDPNSSSDTAVRVLLLILCCVLLKRWVEDEVAEENKQD